MPSQGLFERFINFYTDFAFKKFFGTPANKEFLISFLNALLKLKDDEEVKDITHLNSEQLPKVEHDRKAIYDVYCENNKGEKFIVEMQKAPQTNFIDRSIYYSAFPIQEQGVKGYLYKLDDKNVGWNYSLKKVYVISVLNFELDYNVIGQAQNDADDKHTHIVTHAKLRFDEYPDELYSDKLEFINIEMPKFKKTEDELSDMLDKWLYAMKNLYHLADRPKALREAIFKKLFNLAEISKYDTAERLAYQDSLKDYRDYYNTIETAEQKGRAEERAKAHEEKLRLACKFHKSGLMSLEQVASTMEIDFNELSEYVEKTNSAGC